MLVQRVYSPVLPLESWTVLGDDDVPVAPIERYLTYLSDIERSPNTVKAYAHDLKDWFTFHVRVPLAAAACARRICNAGSTAAAQT